MNSLARSAQESNVARLASSESVYGIGCLCKVPESAEGFIRASFDNRVHYKIRTCGDGKCALHARFGVLSPAGFLRLGDVPSFIYRMFTNAYDPCFCYSQLYERSDSVGQMLLSSIVSNIWQGLFFVS